MAGVEVVEAWRRLRGLWLDRHGLAVFASLHPMLGTPLQGIMVFEQETQSVLGELSSGVVRIASLED